MSNNSLEEQTKPLYDIGDLNNANNQIYEVLEEKEKKEDLLEVEEQKNGTFFEPPKKKKGIEKIKDWWKKRTKKQKGLIIAGIVLFVILACIGIIFLVKSLHKEEPVSPPPADVIVQEENYRYENGSLIFLNSNKEEIGKYTCQNQNENLCFVSYYTDDDDFDIEHKTLKDGSPIPIRSAIVGETFVFISDNPKESDTTVSLYNIKKETVENTFEAIKRVSNNKERFITKNNQGKYGVMDLTGEAATVKINNTFDYLGYVENKNNFYVAIQNNQNTLVDENGNNKGKAFLGKIKNIKDDKVKILLDTGKYEIYNINGQNLLNENYDYIELFDDYAVLIDDNNKMFLKYYDKNKLNEEAIPLNSKDYVKTSIYDENNTLIETKQAFSVEENGSIITISIMKDKEPSIIKINKAEGNRNKQVKYANYFDGKLYIYRDLEKTDLIGSYPCANKNNITDNNSSLNNCFLAKDTIFENNDLEIPGKVGTIPVLNERFVFVADNPDLVNDENKTVVVYDLKKGTSIGKYSEVNTYSYTGTDEITFTTVGELQVVAKNKSNKFGVIKIGLSDVGGHINFNYNAIESLNDYYVAKDANGYLLLRKKDGASMTSAITYKIRNYNDTAKYVSVLNNNKYFIYNYQNNPLNMKENGYNYIELYDNFFATVDANNILSVYTYDSPNTNLIADCGDCKLELTNYYGNGTKAFKINATGNKYEIQKGNASNMYQTIYEFSLKKEEE